VVVSCGGIELDTWQPHEFMPDGSLTLAWVYVAGTRQWAKVLSGGDERITATGIEISPIRMHLATANTGGMTPEPIVAWMRAAIGQTGSDPRITLEVQPNYLDTERVSYSDVFPTSVVLVDTDTYPFGTPRVRPDFTVELRANGRQ
jgi:hypothetical protein